MTTVRKLLQKKGHDVWSTSPESSVYSALEIMAEKNIGALVVLDGSKVAGMFSERDYARKVVLKGRASREIPVGEIMTPNPFTVGPDQTVQECMALMTEKHVRHLPVIDEGRLIGIISIGDVVKEIIAEQSAVIDHLTGYITGKR
jgi:CBS domain-containing protein